MAVVVARLMGFGGWWVVGIAVATLPRRLVQCAMECRFSDATCEMEDEGKVMVVMEDWRGRKLRRWYGCKLQDGMVLLVLPAWCTGTRRAKPDN